MLSLTQLRYVGLFEVAGRHETGSANGDLLELATLIETHERCRTEIEIFEQQIGDLLRYVGLQSSDCSSWLDAMRQCGTGSANGALPLLATLIARHKRCRTTFESLEQQIGDQLRNTVGLPTHPHPGLSIGLSAHTGGTGCMQHAMNRRNIVLGKFMPETRDVCARCGKGRDLAHRFCPFCGYSLSNTSETLTL
eukprot:TRINITY_DN38268_c0_g1_i1.p1 TRINITY_DN38268_c0_g1~~TRINITY_DN38268_c0_g1_i1.p1  ORF type:complete len:194 (+),score=29.16 TRINITY_DN38268_c0_g1_i1:52-633(+)